MSKELKEKLETMDRHFDFIQEAYNVKKIGVFGSLVKGKQRRGSDVDVLVEFSQPVGFIKFIELENFLSKKLDRKVDLTTKKALKPVVKKDILKEVVYV